MCKTFKIFTILFLFAPSLFAQTTHHTTLWTKASGVIKFSPKHSAELELIYRRQSFFEQNNINPFAKNWISAARVWYYYQPQKLLTIIVSPISVWDNKGLISQFQDTQKPAQRELRSLLGEEIKLPLNKKWELNQRNLLDFRFIRPIGTKDYVEKNRFRTRLGIKYSFDSKYSISLADEYFLFYGKGITTQNHFDQNRIIAGFSYKISQKLKLDLNTMLIHQQRKTINTFDEINSIVLGVNYIFDIKKNK